MNTRQQAKALYNKCKTHGDIVDYIEKSIILQAERDEAIQALDDAADLLNSHSDIYNDMTLYNAGKSIRALIARLVPTGDVPKGKNG